MAVAATPTTVGQSLRWWREHRRMTQLDLSRRADVSSRHISFIETGRSAPTAGTILRPAECLDVPLRDRNSMLLSAGLAPAYTQRQLSEPPLSMINDAIEHVLAAHAPYPALVVDRQWDLVAANDAVYALTAGAAQHLLEPPVNVLRLTLHPDGMAAQIVNHAEWRAHILARLQHERDSTADTHLDQLLKELHSYPVHPRNEQVIEPNLVVPMRVRTDDGIVSLFSTTTVFGTQTDVTVSELAIETFYPEDEASAGFFRRMTHAS